MNEICLSCRKHTKCGRAKHETIGCGYYVPLTEQEYLQTCDTEQLAEWLQEHMDCSNCDCNKDLCYKGYDCCKLAFLEWLKQPHTTE